MIESDRGIPQVCKCGGVSGFVEVHFRFGIFEYLGGMAA
jgi:hypothetical protein